VEVRGFNSWKNLYRNGITFGANFYLIGELGLEGLENNPKVDGLIENRGGGEGI
jgi:hypothetical protein